MTDQVESLDVGFQDGVSAGAKKATDAVTGLGDAFTTTEAKAARAGKGTKKATDEVAAGAAAAGKAIDAYAGTVERADQRVKRHAQTADQLANKFDRTKREAAAVARAIAPYQRALDDLEASSATAAQKEELRATITAKMEAATEKARAAVARYFKDVEAGAAAATAAAGGLSAGMAAATASAGSWAGALGKVYETAGSATGGLTQAARALHALNADFQSGHANMAEWTAGAKGLEASLRGVSAAQKAINDATGISRQTANAAVIGPTRYATTGRGSSGTGSITFGDDGSAQRLDDITAAFAEADAKLDGYRASLGLTDVAQQRYDAGLAELQATIRRAGVDEAEATRLLTAYAAAHDPAIKKAQELAAAQATAAREVEQAERAALAKMSADWDAAVREREADAAMIIAAEKEAAAAVKQEEAALRSLIGTIDKTFGADEKLVASQRQLDRALTDGVGGIKLTTEQHAALSAKLKEQHELSTRAATSTKLAAHESLNLGYQIQDFVVQVGSGQSALTAMLQQGPQAVGAVGGMSRAWALLTSTTALATLGIGVFVGALAMVGARAVQIASQTRELTATMRAYGTEAQTTAGHLRDTAKALYEGGADRGESFATAKALASIRGISAGMGRELALLGSDMTAGLGGTVDDMTKQLAAMVTDGYPAIMKLQEATRFLNAEEVEAIRTMAEHRRQSEALGVALDALHRRFDGLRKDSMSPAAAAMHELGVQFNRLVDAAAASTLTIKVEIVLSEKFKLLADFFEGPSKDTFARLAASTLTTMLPGSSKIEYDAPKPPTDDEVRKTLQGQLDAARAKVQDLESRSWLGGPHGGYKASFQGPLETARAEVSRLEDRLTAISAKAASLAAAAATSGPPAHRAANDLSPADIAWSEQNAKATEYVKEQTHEVDRLSASLRGNAVDRALATAAMRAQDEIRDKHLEGIPAENLLLLRQREALLQLQVAVSDNIRAAAAEVAGADLVARAYGQSTAAVREAEIQAKALAEVARGSIEPYDAIVGRLRSLDDAQRKVQAAQFGQSLRQQTEDAQRLADAWGRGANAAREAGLANEALAEARKRGLDPNRDAGQIQDIAGGILARDTAQRAQQFAQVAADQRQAIDLANAEWGMLGRSNAERARSVAMLQAANDLRNKGVDLTDAGTQAYVRQQGELARVQTVLQDSAQQAANIAQPITTAFEDVVLGSRKAGDAAKALGKDLERIFLRVTVTKPFETWATGTLTKIMSGPAAVANDNTPTPANDPGALDRILGAVKGGLGSSASNPMWVQMAGSNAAVALDPRSMTGSAPMPVAIKDGGQVVDMLRSEARAQGVPEDVVLAVAKIESGFRQFRDDGRVLTSSAGAQGVMQLMPDTAKWLGVDATDTRQNIQGGVKFLSMLGRQFGGDWNAVAGAYNAGPTRMNEYLRDGRALPSETVGYMRNFGTTVKSVGTDVASLGSRVDGVTKAQEDALQAQLDAVTAQRAAAESTQTLTVSQQSLVDSVLGVRVANDNATSIIEVQSRAVSHISDGAISAADGLDQAGSSATKFGDAAADGADTFVGGLQKLLGGAGDWISSLFGGSSSAQQQKVIKNTDGSTSFAPAAKGAGGSWLDAKVFGSGEQSRPSADFVGPMPQQSGLGGWNPTWGQVIQGIGGIASGAAMATQRGATVGQKIGGGLTAAGGIAAMIPGGQVIGGVMMAAGALLSAVTGAKDRGEKYSISHITLGANGRYALGAYAQDNDGDPTRFNSDASKVAKGLNDIVARLNLTPTGKDSYIDSKNKSAEQAALELLKGMKSGVPEISYAIAHEAAVSLEDMLSHLEFANSFNNQVQALRSSISDLFSQFQTGVEAGNSLGRTLMQFVDNAQTVFAVAAGSKLPGFARGTLSAPSGWAIVGEEGPELVRLSGGERIWNARESARMLASQGVGADTELVHVRPDELAWMQRTLGGMQTNPRTGLPMFLEGDSGGVGDTGGSASPGGNSNGAGPMGGENAATGSAYGSTADRDAAYGGGWGTSSGGGIGNTISGWVSAVTGWMAALAGWQADTAENTQAQTEALAAVAGLTPTAVAAALSATAQVAGYGLTGMLEGITGEKGTAAAVSHDYGDMGTGGLSDTAGTIGERAAASGGHGGFWQGASATEIDSTLQALAAAIKADPTGKLTTDMVSSSRVGSLSTGGISIQELADDPSKIFGFRVGDAASALQELDTAAQQLLTATGAVPEVLQKALEGANAQAAAVGIPTATAARRVQEEQAQQKADALQQKFDSVGLVRDRVSELNDIVVSLADNTFTPVGKDFDKLAADMRKAADAYVAAGQSVPDGLFGAMKQMEALGAVKQRLLDEVAGVTVESSPEQQKVEQIRGKWSNTATDLVKAFASVGIVGDELAAKLNQGFNNALKKEQGSYSDSLDVAYRKAKGEEGYDSATGLIDSYKTAVKDVNALWPEGADRAAQMAKVTGTLTSNMGGLVKSGSITSASLQQIIAAFADTPDVVRAATTALQQLNDAAAEAARSFAASVSARMYAAVGNSRASGLITLDEQQRKELADATTAGRDTAQLRLVQSAERASQAFTLAQQDVVAWYDQEITARQTFISDLQDGALKVAQVAKQFAAARDALAISEDAPISPQERLAEARRQWDVALATVRSTTASEDEQSTARSTLTSLSQTLVSLEKANSAGTSRALYDEVMQVLGQMGTIAPDASAATAEADLKVAQDSLKELQRARTEAAAVGQRQLGSLDNLKDVMNQSLAVWQAALPPLQNLTGANDNRMRYSASTAVQTAWDGLSSAQQMGVVRSMGWGGAIDESFNFWLAADSGRASNFEQSVSTIAGGARYAAPEDVGRAWEGLTDAQRLAAVHAAGYDGGVDAGLNAWVRLGHAAAFEAAVRGAAHTAGVPGFAMGTLSTPPGAVWVGERGPELLWQGGGAAVASSVDSMRIASMYQTTANDRFPPSVAPIRPPAGPVASEQREILAVLRDIARRIARLEAAIHEAEGEAQTQRNRIAKDEIKLMRQQLDELRDQQAKRAA